jgi:putative ABC transport system permease protein
VLTFRVSLPGRTYPTDTAQWNFAAALEEHLRAIPGVRTAALSSALPLDGSDFTIAFHIRGRPKPPEKDMPSAQITSATPEFFSALGIPLLRGRAFARDDRAGAPRVAIASQSFVRKYFSKEDPVGQYVELGWTRDGVQQGGEIVGIVGDVKQYGLEQAAPPILYLPYTQTPRPSLRAILRTAVPPEGVAPAARAAVRETDRELPVFAMREMREYLSESVESRRFYALLVGLFAAVALALAAVGLYGVMAYAVTQRTHELGVRVALGATGERISRMVVGQGIALTLGGVALGIAAALVLSRVIGSLLFGVSRADPVTFASVLGTLVLVATLASYVPARRAARVDPLIAMRGE